MAFLINCNNKGCGKFQEPALSLQDNEVYCGECGKVISGISHFTKTQMKSLGQILKPAKSAYAVRCLKCKQEATPKIDKDNKLICGNCSNLHQNVSKPFEILIRDSIKKGIQEL